MNPHNGSSLERMMYDEFGLEILPDPPENPEFNELFTDAEQDAIALKFERGVVKHNEAMRALYARSAADNAARLERKAQVEARRARFLAGRFNPVLRSHP